MARSLARVWLSLCFVTALALSVVASPAPSSLLAASVRGALDKVAEAVAHPMQLHADLAHDHEHHEAGSLHAATQNILDQHADAASAGNHPISAKNQAKAAAFVAHLDRLVAGLKAKSHLARLSNKYPSSRTSFENATLAHAEAEAAHEAQQAEEVERAVEEDEFGRLHVQPSRPMHAPAGSAEAHMHSKVSGLTTSKTRASSAHIPHSDAPAAITAVHIVDHDHPVLSPVPPAHRRRRPKRRLTDDEYVLHPIQLPPSSPSPSGLNFTTFVYPTIQGNVTIFVGITEWPLGKFHIYPSPREEMDEISLLDRERAKQRYKQQHERSMRAHIVNSFVEVNAKLNPLCDGVATTSVSAQAYNCLLAQNAGFFNMQTDGCMGNVVSNDQFINHATPDLIGHPHFGLTRKGNFITGYMTEEEVAEGVDGGFHELVQGSGWLVREGQNYINQSAARENIGEHFVTEKAPRNAIGHDTEGRLLMFEADGEEDINLGLTLIEFADILTHHFSVENAINVDGGGSSTTVYKGEVADRPTCRDTPQICERPVTTISCVMP
jgi:hypothetical protein